MPNIDTLETSEIILQPKKVRAISAILLTPNFEAAARETGISVKTLRHWMDDPAFAAALKHASTQALSMAVHRIIFMADKALSTLEEIMDDPKAPAYARSRAASDVLGAIVRLRSLHNDEIRLQELESRLTGIEAHKGGRWQRS